MKRSSAHRKQVRRYKGSSHLHELTFSTYRRFPLLTSDPWRRIVAARLDSGCELARFHLFAFVFMPEHVHLLVDPTESSATVSKLLAWTKRQSSVGIKQLLLQHQSPLLAKLTIQQRPGQQTFRFWQEGGGFDRNLYSPEAVAASIEYIHNNPVKRGLCRRPVDWKWSSAKFYEERTTRPEWPRLTLPDPSWWNGFGVQKENS
ncbi:transposase [Bremerella sp. JC817]|uniref:REP-associated tyrosine transposase n=1 Tax=Bremerella sp. JC817 TaxID=3231756 RepID=UPI003458D27E